MRTPCLSLIHILINGPMNIYEMHAGSWKMKEGGKPYNYSELADELIPYIKDMGYTLSLIHI